MSTAAIAWAFAQDVGGPHKNVLVALADHADAQGRCYPSQRRLAFMTGRSVRQVRRDLARLEAEGWITRRETRRESDGGRTSDTIWLNAPPEALDPSRGADDGGDHDRVPVKRPPPTPPDKVSGGPPGQRVRPPPDKVSGPPRTRCPGKNHQLEPSEGSGGGPALEPPTATPAAGHHPETEAILRRTFGRLYDQLLLEEPQRARWAGVTPEQLAALAHEIRGQPSVQAFSTRLKEKLDELVGVRRAPPAPAGGAATPSEARARLERQAAAARASEEAYDAAIAGGATPDEADRAAAAAYARALKGSSTGTTAATASRSSSRTPPP